MSIQNYKNHAKYYTPHHFIFYPLLLVLLGFGVHGILEDDSSHTTIWIIITALLLLTGWLSFMMRQHYALGTQNRMVRMEMRFRYYVLTGQRLEPLEQRLSFRQLAALRFAPDDELPGLLQRVLEENLSAADIKKSIKNWLPDNMRV